MSEIKKIIKDLENIYELCLNKENFASAIQAKKAIADIVLKSSNNDDVYDFENYTESQLDELIRKLEARLNNKGN